MAPNVQSDRSPIVMTLTLPQGHAELASFYNGYVYAYNYATRLCTSNELNTNGIPGVNQATPTTDVEGKELKFNKGVALSEALLPQCPNCARRGRDVGLKV